MFAMIKQIPGTDIHSFYRHFDRLTLKIQNGDSILIFLICMGYFHQNKRVNPFTKPIGTFFCNRLSYIPVVYHMGLLVEILLLMPSVKSNSEATEQMPHFEVLHSLIMSHADAQADLPHCCSHTTKAIIFILWYPWSGMVLDCIDS